MQYTYDAAGRRIARLLDADGNGQADQRTYWAYQGDDPLVELSDPDGLGGGVSPTLSHRYFYGTAVDQVLAVESPGQGQGTVLWGMGDHEGTIRDVLSAAGAVQDHRRFDSFGQVTSQTNSAVDLVFAYAGRPLDADSGLYDYRARWYDPRVGRMASEDPSGFGGRDMNLYRYVGNNPWTNTDPTGLCLKKAVAAFSSAVAGAWNGAVGTVTNAYSAWSTATTINSYYQSAASAVSSGWNDVSNIASGAWDAIRPIVAQPLVTAIDTGMGIVNRMASTSMPAPQSALSDAPAWDSSGPVATIQYAPGATNVPLPPIGPIASLPMVQTPPTATSQIASTDQERLDYAQRLMQQMMLVGDRLHGGGPSMLSADTPYALENTGSAEPGYTGNLYVQPGPNYAKVYFPKDWPKLAGMMSYSMARYNKVGGYLGDGVWPAPSRYINADGLNFSLLPGISLDSQLLRSNYDLAIVETLIHEPQHNLGSGFLWLGFGHGQMAGVIPTEGDKGQSTWQYFVDFLITARLATGENLLSVMRTQAGPIPVPQNQ